MNPEQLERRLAALEAQLHDLRQETYEGQAEARAFLLLLLQRMKVPEDERLMMVRLYLGEARKRLRETRPATAAETPGPGVPDPPAPPDGAAGLN
jgi:lipase chaperone LimK